MERFIVIFLSVSKQVTLYYINVDDQNYLSHPLQLIFTSLSTIQTYRPLI